MPVETFAYIDSLNVSNPPGSDGLAQGDDHLRGIKSTLKNSFTGITGATNVTQTTLNAIQAGTHEFQVPTGAFLDFAIGTIPTGWLECNGQAVSRTTYARLFAAIGGGYGVGDGSTTFNVPNTADRYKRSRSGTYALGAAPAWQVGTHGHTASASTSVSIAGDGSHNHTGATGAESAAHNHNIGSDGTHSHGGATGAADRSLDHTHAGGDMFDASNFQFCGSGGIAVTGTVNNTGSGNTGGVNGSIDHLHGISADGAHAHGGVTAAENQNHVHGISTDGFHSHGASGSTSVTVNNSTTQENMPFTFVVITCIKT